MPPFSIITINLNNSTGLYKTIESVLSQTFNDFEFIIIDGGSTDGSREIIEQYKNKITYYISEKDKGVYNAMNKGITAAKGEYCLFLNSGDLLSDKNVLQNVFSQQDSKDIIYGNMKVADAAGNIKHLKMPDRIGARQLYADTLWHPVSLIKRNLFLKYGVYNEQLKIAGDYEFFVRMILLKKVSTQHVSVEIAQFDVSGISADVSNHKLLSEERRKIQDEYFNPVLLFIFRIYSRLRS